MQIENDVIKLPMIGAGPSYEGAHIWLPQLVLEAARRGEEAIIGKTFQNCFLEGPAVLLPVAGCSFDGCNMGDVMGDVRNILLQPVGPQKVTGTVAFRDCKFINCRFLRVGFTGSPDFLKQVEQRLGGSAQ